MIGLLLLAATAVQTPPNVAAVDDALKADNATVKACMDDPRNYGQADMDVCAVASFRRADAALNVQWIKTLAIYKRGDAAAQRNGAADNTIAADNLLKGQRAWLVYRQANCKAMEVLGSWGTIAPMNYAFCMADITWKRVRELAGMTVDPNSGEQM